MANFLILGGTSSIAKALALQLQQDQHTVTLCGRNESALGEIAHNLACQYFVSDLSQFDSVGTVFEKHLDQIGEIDGVVNCAGSLLLKTAENTSQQEYFKVVESNLTTAFATVHAAQKYMAQQGGSVLLFSSSAALTGLANHEAIAAAKAGIIGLTLAAAASSAAKNIRFNALAPGLVETHLTAPMLSSSLAREYATAMHPLGRIGHVDDIARVACFLLDPKNNWITGQILAIDGGLSAIKTKPRQTK